MSAARAAARRMQRATGVATARAMQTRESRSPALAILAAAASSAIAWTLVSDSSDSTALCAAAAAAPTPEPVEGNYKDQPILHVAALLLLYEDIDKNMEVLAGRMLEDLQRRVNKEKEENNGKLLLTPEQIALNMSIEFESTLEKVQDAVFRNNYVTKQQVQDALQRLVNGELRGGGANGKLTVQEAEAIEAYVKRLERLRWKVTGSREPLIPTQHRPLVKQDKPEIALETVVQVMEKLIPLLTSEMETIVRSVRTTKGSHSAAQQQQLITAQYIRRSGELTEQLCKERQLDLRAFQAALVYYHDDPAFEKALARLSADQQRRFAALGL